MVFICKRGHSGSLALRDGALLKTMHTCATLGSLCLTMWVESTAILHGAILSQFSQLPQAENEQSTDKMRKCIVDCVVYLLYDGIQWKSCRLSAGNWLAWTTLHKYSLMISTVMYPAHPTIFGPDSVLLCFHWVLTQYIHFGPQADKAL